MLRDFFGATNVFDLNAADRVRVVNQLLVQPDGVDLDTNIKVLSSAPFLSDLQPQLMTESLEIYDEVHQTYPRVLDLIVKVAPQYCKTKKANDIPELIAMIIEKPEADRNHFGDQLMLMLDKGMIGNDQAVELFECSRQALIYDSAQIGAYGAAELWLKDSNQTNKSTWLAWLYYFAAVQTLAFGAATSLSFFMKDLGMLEKMGNVFEKPRLALVQGELEKIQAANLLQGHKTSKILMNQSQDKFVMIDKC